MNEKGLRYLSTFSGIGGFELGIQRAFYAGAKPEEGGASNGYSPDSSLKQKREPIPVCSPGKTEDTEHACIGKKSESKKRGQGRQRSSDKRQAQLRPRDGAAPLCIGYSELDRHAIQIYRGHFPEHRNWGDITRIDAAELPDFDLLVGGFPCQAFSIAGRRGGFTDTRGTLFFDLARILKTKRPRLFLFENVKGLLSHDGGRTFATIVSTVDELGYDLQWQVLNSKDFGVPQNRERVFLVGHTRDTPRPQVFPFWEDSGENAPFRAGKQTGETASTLTAGYSKNPSDADYIRVGTLRTHKDGEGFREVKSGLAPTIPARAREDGSGQPVIQQRPRGKNAGGAHALAPTITGKSYQDNNLAGGVRRLTPTECERLQGFPDSWTAGVSDTQRYKTLGNAVTVNVIQAIVEKIYESLELDA